MMKLVHKNKAALEGRLHCVQQFSTINMANNTAGGGRYTAEKYYPRPYMSDNDYSTTVHVNCCNHKPVRDRLAGAVAAERQSHHR